MREINIFLKVTISFFGPFLILMAFAGAVTNGVGAIFAYLLHFLLFLKEEKEEEGNEDY